MTPTTATLTLSLARSGGVALGLSLSLSTGSSAGPPVVGSALWLDALRPGTMFQDAARTTLAGVGDPVGSWYDPDSGIGAIQSGAARPVRAAAWLAFDGIDDFLDAAIGARPQPETLYLVLQGTGDAAATQTITDSVNSLNAGRLLTTSGAPFRHLTLFSGAPVENTARAYGTLMVASLVIHGASSVLRVNGVEVAANAGTSTGSGLRLGANGNAPQANFAGQIRMVLRYAAAHSAAERLAVETWAAARHGVTL